MYYKESFSVERLDYKFDGSLAPDVALVSDIDHVSYLCCSGDTFILDPSCMRFLLAGPVVNQLLIITVLN